MGSRRKNSSPVLNLAITKAQHQRAVDSNSGGCLIADAIKEQYPHLSHISVDMATIRVTDRKAGERYIYLTPPAAAHLLLSYDQGWPNPTERLTIRGAVSINPIYRTKATSRAIAERRAERLAELRAKVERGEKLSAREKQSLTKLSNPPPAPDRPTSPGAKSVVTSARRVIVRGGRVMPQGPAHPNLLRGRNRVFGAKLADPGRAFRDAVDAAVAEKEKGAITLRRPA